MESTQREGRGRKVPRGGPKPEPDPRTPSQTEEPTNEAPWSFRDQLKRVRARPLVQCCARRECSSGAGRLPLSSSIDTPSSTFRLQRAIPKTHHQKDLRRGCIELTQSHEWQVVFGPQRIHPASRPMHDLDLLEMLWSRTRTDITQLREVLHLGPCLCERVVYRNGALLLIVRECSGLIPRRFRPHGS